jgi:hypothetical protein
MQTTKLSDSMMTATCDQMAAQAVTAKIIEAGAGKVQPKDSAVVRSAAKLAAAFEASKGQNSPATDSLTPGTEAADSAVVRSAAKLAAAFEASKHGAGQ